MLARALAVASLLLAPGAAAAQARTYSVEEIASDLAYGFCPLFLADQFPLDSPQLAERGFDGKVVKQPHPRVGEMSVVVAKRDDGEITFGGAAGKACNVVVTGPKTEEALDKLRATMSWTGLDFQPTANVTPVPAGMSVETFKAAVEGQTLYVQLVQIGGATPAVSAQLFTTDK